jgi:cation:H+ antiporter
LAVRDRRIFAPLAVAVRAGLRVDYDMDLQTALAFGAGLILLIGGAELLVRGASRLAAAFGVSALVIGLTVVAFGTGSPELAVAIRASIAGQPDIAVGNVIGSNIFNILFILGLSALIVPLIVHDQLVRLDVPVMIAVSAMLFLMASDGTISRLDGVALSTAIVGYTVFLLRHSRANLAENGQAHEPGNVKTWAISLLLVVGGLAALVLGSRWLVDGAVEIARALGVSELVIGLTVIAAGTSLPEVATSIVAGIRGQRDIAVGNVVGSNIYNILMVLGFAAVVAPRGLVVAPAAINFDLPVMLAVAVACFPIFISGHRIGRVKGGLFLGYWVAYTAYVILDAAGHDALPEYSAVMSFFVIPLTAMMLIGFTVRGVRRRATGT